jgi:lipopolysaccharide transport system ATP-binding protein
MNTVISVEHLSKAYRLGQIGSGRLADDLKVWWARSRGKPNPLLRIGQEEHGNRAGETIWALKDVNFQVEQGEVLGIIGRNGAGKSTLLKILSRVTAPTSGHAHLKGRIASLLEVGTGFHPDLTGCENIYLNGAILGMKRGEIERKFDEIVDFAEIEQFIDTPVKRYSSGMYVRLAFAVAAHLEPEILLVDEVLAVGDSAFQKKCLGKMGEVAKGGRTVLFVSHNMASISALCPRSILLAKGSMVKDDLTDIVIEDYNAVSAEITEIPISQRKDREGIGPLRFIDAWIEDKFGNRTTSVQLGQAISIVAEYQVQSGLTMKNPYMAIAIRDAGGLWLTDLWNQGSGYSWDVIPASGRFRCNLPKLVLNEGEYFFSLCCITNGETADYIVDAGQFHVEKADYFGTGKMPTQKFTKILMDQIWTIEGADR